MRQHRNAIGTVCKMRCHAVHRDSRIAEHRPIRRLQPDHRNAADRTGGLGIVVRSAAQLDGKWVRVVQIDDDPDDPCVRLMLKEEQPTAVPR